MLSYVIFDFFTATVISYLYCFIYSARILFNSKNIK